MPRHGRLTRSPSSPVPRRIPVRHLSAAVGSLALATVLTFSVSACSAVDDLRATVDDARSQAQQALDKADEVRDQLGSLDADTRAQAEEAVAQAQDALTQAQSALDDAQESKADAEQSLADAQASLDAARAKVEVCRRPPRRRPPTRCPRCRRRSTTCRPTWTRPRPRADGTGLTALGRRAPHARPVGRVRARCTAVAGCAGLAPHPGESAPSTCERAHPCRWWRVWRPETRSARCADTTWSGGS